MGGLKLADGRSEGGGGEGMRLKKLWTLLTAVKTLFPLERASIFGTQGQAPVDIKERETKRESYLEMTTI